MFLQEPIQMNLKLIQSTFSIRLNLCLSFEFNPNKSFGSTTKGVLLGVNPNQFETSSIIFLKPSNPRISAGVNTNDFKTHSKYILKSSKSAPPLEVNPVKALINS